MAAAARARRTGRVASERALNSREVWLQVARDTAPVPPPELAAFVSQQTLLPAATPCDTWLPAWLPIGESTGDVELFVDLRPGPRHGCVMRYDAEGGADPEPVWADAAAMLHDIADALEGHRPAAGHQPYVDDLDRLFWR